MARAATRSQAKAKTAAAKKTSKTSNTAQTKKGSAAVVKPKPKRNARVRVNRIPKYLLDRFDGCTVAQIKKALQARDLDITGLKQDLFLRLVADEEREAADEEEDADADDESSLPDYESDPPAPQQAAAAASSSQQAKEDEEEEEEKPKGPYDCVAHFRNEKMPNKPTDKEELPQPHHFFIPDAALDTCLAELWDETSQQVRAILQKLGGMNQAYIQMKTRDVLQWHMPERYLIARINMHHEQGLEEEEPFYKVCQTTWGNKLPENWRTIKFMAVVDAAPAFLREWSDALKAEKLCYPQMPTNYAENPNQQWSFGRALLTTPKLLKLFKKLVAEGKLVLPCAKDTSAVTKKHLLGIKW